MKVTLPHLRELKIAGTPIVVTAVTSPAPPPAGVDDPAQGVVGGTTLITIGVPAILSSRR